MSVKMPVVWEAPPHTIAKLEMLYSYLVAWFSILGVHKSFSGKDLWYIDGFAGPGEYRNHPDGSPAVAIRAAETAMQKAGGSWKAGAIHCVFIEEDKARFSHLEGRLSKLPMNSRIHRHSFQGTFRDGINDLRLKPANPFKLKQPLFAFVDPFGPEGLAFDVLKKLIDRPACEILVNLDSDGISRVHRAGENANHRVRLNEVFGSETWEAALSGIRTQTAAARKIVDLYKTALRDIPNVRYVFAFEMQSKKNAINYHLVFASQHPTGLQKMKEVMKKIDQNGTYGFSDANVGQGTMFSFDDPAAYSHRLQNHFKGLTVPYDAVNDFTLNETPFVNPKAMLKDLESRGMIIVSGASIRKPKTYPDDLHPSLRIQFLSENGNA